MCFSITVSSGDMESVSWNLHERLNLLSGLFMSIAAVTSNNGNLNNA